MKSEINLNLNRVDVESILKQKNITARQIDLFFEECKLQKQFFSGKISWDKYLKKIQKIN